MIVRHVLAHEADRLRGLRLRALKEDPHGFSSTYEREVALEDDWWTSRAALSEAGEKQRMYVITDDQDRWLGLALARDDAGTAVLNAMWVAPEGRGQGAATALCDACAGWAKERGFEALHVGVFEANAPARRMYEAAGFVASGEEEDGLLQLRRTL